MRIRVIDKGLLVDLKNGKYADEDDVFDWSEIEWSVHNERDNSHGNINTIEREFEMCDDDDDYEMLLMNEAQYIRSDTFDFAKVVDKILERVYKNTYKLFVRKEERRYILPRKLVDGDSILIPDERINEKTIQFYSEMVEAKQQYSA